MCVYIKNSIKMCRKSAAVLIYFGLLLFGVVVGDIEPQLDNNADIIQTKETSTTNSIKVTTESLELLSTPEKLSDQNDEEESSTIAQMAKLRSTIAPTTAPQLQSTTEKSTTIVTTEDVNEDEEEGSTVTVFAKTEMPIGEQSNDSPTSNDDSKDETTIKNTNAERVTANDVTTVTTEPVTVPQAKSEFVSSSTTASITKPNERTRIVSKDDIESIRGRALNLSGVEHRQPASGVIYVTAPPTQSMPKSLKTFSDDLSDVSMDNDGMEVHSSEHIAPTQTATLTHEPECLSKDGCNNAEDKVSPSLFHESGSMETVSAAVEQDSSEVPTKKILEQAMHGKSPPAIVQNNDYCMFKGKKYAIHEQIEDGCEQICRCVASTVSVECEPRCPKMNHTTATHDQCVTVPDPKDVCCHIELCDVTLNDHEQMGAIAIVPAPPSFVDASKHKKENRTMIEYKERASSSASSIPAMSSADDNDSDNNFDCEHNGNKYKKGQQFNEGCDSLCICMAEGVHCEKIECPSTFGLEIMDPHCLEWAPEPATFRAIVPKCCPERMRCIDNGTCEYKGQYFDNWSDIPANLTGCEQHCFCERGKVECRPSCSVPAKPPKHLKCNEKQIPKVVPIPDDECCKHWACVDATNDDSAPSSHISSNIDSIFIHKKPIENENNDHKEENGIHPLYPTSIGQPNKGVQVPVKPTKKPTKTDTKYPGPIISQAPTKLEPPTKYDSFDNYDDVDEEDNDKKPISPELGNGFFNPSLTKHQYPDYDFNGDSYHRLPPETKPQKPNQYNPFIIQHGDGKHELILGGNGQNHHLNIEHILQQIQGGNGGSGIDGGQSQPPYGVHHQAPNGLSYPFGIGQHPLSQIPNESNQKIPLLPAGFGLSTDIQVIALEAVNGRTVRVVFNVPQIYVGLHGRVEIRYTKGRNNDTNMWQQQIFAPPEDLIATSQMEFELGNLDSNSEYHVKIALMLHDINAQPTSKVYRVQTPAEAVITPPPLIDTYETQQPVIGSGNMADILKNIQDPELRANEVNSTWIRLSWRKLNEEELVYVDGIQLRYKEVGGIIYDATPLIHRTINTFTIENLKPETAYEFGLFFIPFPGHGAELRAGKMHQLRTTPVVDVYGFDVTVNVTKIKMGSVEVLWSGVPYPEDKYVNIYRTIVQSDSGKEDSSVFKVAKHDSTTGTLIADLKPGIRYQLWLEMYLTNGKIKKSNVVDFTTKPGVLGKTGKLSSDGELNQAGMTGNYYGPLVIVSVIAAISLMSTLVLLLIVTRRRGQSASITPPRKNDVSYDNPSYKVELQHQETMNL
ncbi:putative epidermal cell surface receptor isoform X2 [Contarinia nasturtii]|uniref:putative epidermal cell surface receptor isoform X2 n=1 Tax=Contarinia nasturtii TaxID=265458 RepID=UPI0012D3814D|nr:putative epidermal cell surface receptor isoform X2 [Contarinia nasturtii]